MGVGPQLGEHLGQHHCELWPRTGAAHGAFEAQFQGHLLELFAVFVLAVVNCMDEFMHQGVDHIEKRARRHGQ